MMKMSCAVVTRDGRGPNDGEGIADRGPALADGASGLHSLLVWFDDVQGVLRVLAVGTVAYAGLVSMVRVSGKRTLSKLNAFDLVATIALGSMLATIVLSKSVPLVEGLTGIALLIGLQGLVSWLATRSTRFQRLLKAEPRLLVRRGQLLTQAMRHERITEEEVLAAARQAGLSDLARAEAVVLESDGALTVLQEPASAGARSTLEAVRAEPLDSTGGRATAPVAGEH